MHAQQTLPRNMTELPPNCAPEFALLTLCSRANLDNNSKKKIVALSTANSFDWALFLSAVKYHRTTSLVFAHLKEVINAQPQPNAITQASAELRHLFIDQARRAAELTDELVSLLDVFEGHSISVIPFKGPLLAERFYGDVALRDYCDLDLLIDPKNAVKVVQILRAQGYAPCDWRNKKLDEGFFESNLLTKLCDGYTFYSDSKQIYIDLHWSIMPQKFFALRRDELWRGTELWTFQGMSVRSFNVEILLAVLCAHGTKHGWQQLAWITDIAEIVQSEKIDWDNLLAISKQAGVEQMVLLGLYLTTFLPGSELPSNICAGVAAAPKVKAAGDKIMHRFFDNPIAGPWSEFETWKFFLALKTSFSEKLALLTELACKPTIDEWCQFPVPEELLFVHRIVRPLSLMLQHAPRLALSSIGAEASISGSKT